jgi:hypothetical protein
MKWRGGVYAGPASLFFMPATNADQSKANFDARNGLSSVVPELAMLRRLIMAVGLTLLASHPAAALDQVSLQLKWKHQFQFAGYYAALEQGFYRDAGLDVTIREGGPDIDAAEAVAGGKADFGVCSSSVLRKWAMGRHLVVLAVIFQQTPGHHSGAAPGRHQKRLGFRRSHADGRPGQRRDRRDAEARREWIMRHCRASTIGATRAISWSARPTRWSPTARANRSSLNSSAPRSAPSRPPHTE